MTFDDTDDLVSQFSDDEEYDFEDVDCVDCGLKFFVRPSLYKDGKPFPTRCERCRKGLSPLYEY